MGKYINGAIRDYYYCYYSHTKFMRLLPGSTFSVCSALYTTHLTSLDREVPERAAARSMRAYDFQ